MKKLFTAIRHKDFESVKELVENKPELVNCTAKQPPKKDDGQSPLQVALKTGAFDIAEYLIDHGANLNFIEDPSCCNSWRQPVVQDAITAAVMNSRWNSNDKWSGFVVHSTKEKANRACAVLEKMLKMGADVNKTDSYGNSGLNRFCLQANQILPSYDYAEQCERDGRIFTEELQSDLERILNLLCRYGADVNYVAPNFGRTVKEEYTVGSLSKLLERIG